MSRVDKIILVIMMIVLDHLCCNLVINLVLRSVEVLQPVHYLILTVGTVLFTSFLIWLTISIIKMKDEEARKLRETTNPVSRSYHGLLNQTNGLPDKARIYYENAELKPEISQEGETCVVEFGNGTVEISSTGTISVSKGKNLLLNVITKSGFVRTSSN